MTYTLRLSAKAVRVVIRALRYYAAVRDGDAASKEAVELANRISRSFSRQRKKRGEEVEDEYEA